SGAVRPPNRPVSHQNAVSCHRWARLGGRGQPGRAERPNRGGGIKLYLFQLAIGQETGSPVPGYLIQTDDGTNILVDTGLPKNLDELPEGMRDRWAVREGDYVVEQLARLGLRPRDIRYVV